jgi:hypothetical protein
VVAASMAPVDSSLGDGCWEVLSARRAVAGEVNVPDVVPVLCRYEGQGGLRLCTYTYILYVSRRRSKSR